MKTLSISDDLYYTLQKFKAKKESFSEEINRLINRDKVSIRIFYGALKESESLKKLEKDVSEFRKKANLRVLT